MTKSVTCTCEKDFTVFRTDWNGPQKPSPEMLRSRLDQILSDHLTFHNPETFPDFQNQYTLLDQRLQSEKRASQAPSSPTRKGSGARIPPSSDTPAAPSLVETDKTAEAFNRKRPQFKRQTADGEKSTPASPERTPVTRTVTEYLPGSAPATTRTIHARSWPHSARPARPGQQTPPSSSSERSTSPSKSPPQPSSEKPEEKR